ncbi:MAG: ATP-dependent helicase [Actinomycetales bacterium]|nr:ATP-dependent helicase [Actinomycetales bacterium]
MPRAYTPTARQAEIRDAVEPGLLVLAPAGCGKTEALALRVRGLINQGRVSAPGRVLVVAFTNRARDNIRDRLRTHLRPDELRGLVTVMNFHGLAARLVRAHGNVVGVPVDVEIPTSDWVTRVCRDEYNLGFDAVAAVNDALRQAKQSARTDAEVLEYLQSKADVRAVQIEERRQTEGRLTYDDMLRLAELILANEQVAGLYRGHFDAAVVDEFQDLTPQQLRVIQRIGYGRTTYAGDLAQGIYRFAGAEPERALEEIRREVSVEISFAESHRSSPAVLDLVNAMAPTVHGQHLTCADPAAWPGDGVTSSLVFDDRNDEADWVHRFAKVILERAPRHRVAVVTRTNSRREQLDAVFARDSDLTSFRWDQPFIDKEVLRLLRDALRRADHGAAARAASYREYLWQLTGGSQIQDPLVRGSLDDAVAWAADLHQDGEAFAQIAGRLRSVDGDTVLTTPGVHLLNGHLGKGQQFEWIVVAGLEEGTLPFFKATSDEEIREEARVLSVMVSRARHGVVLTRVRYSHGRRQGASRFLRDLEAAPTCLDGDGLAEWMETVNWAALAARDGMG